LQQGMTRLYSKMPNTHNNYLAGDTYSMLLQPTFAERIYLWWVFEGELTLDVLTYYGLCAAVGAWQGWLVGCEIRGLLYA
jgi:hypothetical protein